MSKEVITVDKSTEVITISMDEAEQLTEAIRSTGMAMYALIQKAHDSKAWSVLGYTTWEQYVTEEFDFSRGRSYQLLNQAKVISEISAAAEVGELFISEKDARVIKKSLPRITAQVAKETEGLGEEDAKEKAKEIIDSEVTASKSPVRPNLSEQDNDGEDGGYSSGSGGGGDFSGGDYEYEPQSNDVAPSEADRPEVDASNRDYYVENLNKTLSIFTALPSAKDLAQRVKRTKANTPELNQAVRAAATWLELFLSIIEE